jgi:transcriptional regulator GlxA family with amidase domain
MTGTSTVSSPGDVVPANAGAKPSRVSRPGGKDRFSGIEDSIAYMERHLDQPLHVATLAALANLSPSHFFALFKQQTGCTPMVYFTRLRMQHARRLLGSGSASVKEVAAALGYADPFYFSRVFKSVNNIAPSKFISSTPAPIQSRPERAPGTPC